MVVYETLTLSSIDSKVCNLESADLNFKVVTFINQGLG